MGQKQTKQDQRKEQGGGCCGFFCGVIIIVALAVNRITFPDGDSENWCGFQTCGSETDLIDAVCEEFTYQDYCDNCPDTIVDCDDPCNQATSGYAWFVLNIVALLACVVGALAVLFKKGKQFAKFGYIIAGFCLLGAILWFCFASPTCYAYDSDLLDPTLGYSMIFDIIAMIFLFMAVYCVC
eukprot:UN00330